MADILFWTIERRLDWFSIRAVFKETDKMFIGPAGRYSRDKCFGRFGSGAEAFTAQIRMSERREELFEPVRKAQAEARRLDRAAIDSLQTFLAEFNAAE